MGGASQALPGGGGWEGRHGSTVPACVAQFILHTGTNADCWRNKSSRHHRLHSAVPLLKYCPCFPTPPPQIDPKSDLARILAPPRTADVLHHAPGPAARGARALVPPVLHGREAGADTLHVWHGAPPCLAHGLLRAAGRGGGACTGQLGTQARSLGRVRKCTHPVPGMRLLIAAG